MKHAIAPAMMMAALLAGTALLAPRQAAAWGSANRYGGSTQHSAGETSHENAFGGSSEHVAGEGTEHTNAYGGSTAHAYGGGTEHTNMYGGRTAGEAGYGAVHAGPGGAAAYRPPGSYGGYGYPAYHPPVAVSSYGAGCYGCAAGAGAIAGAAVGVAAGAAVAGSAAAAAAAPPPVPMGANIAPCRRVRGRCRSPAAPTTRPAGHGFSRCMAPMGCITASSPCRDGGASVRGLGAGAWQPRRPAGPR